MREENGSKAYAELVGRGRVHRRFYTDPEVFAEEQARIANSGRA